MTIQVLIPAAYSEENFAAQRDNLDRAHVDIEVQPDGARMLTFPEGWFALTFHPQHDAVRAESLVREANGPAVPHQFSFDKGWLQIEEPTA